MEIDLAKGYTGKIELADGTILNVIGGLTASAEKNGKALFKGPLYVNIPDDIYKQGKSGTFKPDSKTTVTYEHGLVTGVETSK